MKATAFSSQSVTTLADAVLSGLMRHAASNNHARLDVMAVLPDARHAAPPRCGRIDQRSKALPDEVGTDDSGARPTLRQTLHKRGRHASLLRDFSERRSSSAPASVI